MVQTGASGLPEVGGAVQGGSGELAEDAQGGDPTLGAEDLRNLSPRLPQIPRNSAHGELRHKPLPTGEAGVSDSIFLKLNPHVFSRNVKVQIMTNIMKGEVITQTRNSAIENITR